MMPSPFVKPAPQRHAEAALRPVEDVLRHPRPDHVAEQPLGGRRVAMPDGRLRRRDFDDAVIEERTARLQ